MRVQARKDEDVKGVLDHYPFVAIYEFSLSFLPTPNMGWWSHTRSSPKGLL